MQTTGSARSSLPRMRNARVSVALGAAVALCCAAALLIHWMMLPSPPLPPLDGSAAMQGVVQPSWTRADSALQGRLASLRTALGRPARIVCASFQRPHYGGAATNAYVLAAALRRASRGGDLARVAAAFFTREGEAAEQFPLDPEGVGGVVGLPRPDYMDAAAARAALQPGRAAVEQELGGAPDVVLAFNYGTPAACLAAFGTQPRLVHVMAGSEALIAMAERGNPGRDVVRVLAARGRPARDWLTATEWRRVDAERAASRVAALTAHVSPWTKEVHRAWHAAEEAAPPADTVLDVTAELWRAAHQVLARAGPLPLWQWRAAVTAVPGQRRLPPACARYFDADGAASGRWLDVVFVASRLDRATKNFALARRVFAHPALHHMCKCVVAADAPRLPLHDLPPNTVVLPLLPHARVVQLLARARVLLLPSHFDAASNTVPEAVAAGCLPLVSDNVGFAELYPAGVRCAPAPGAVAPLPNVLLASDEQAGGEAVAGAEAEADRWATCVTSALAKHERLLRSMRRVLSGRYEAYQEQLLALLEWGARGGPAPA